MEQNVLKVAKKKRKEKKRGISIDKDVKDISADNFFDQPVNIKTKIIYESKDMKDNKFTDLVKQEDKKLRDDAVEMH